MLTIKRAKNGVTAAIIALMMNIVLSVFAVYEIQRSVPPTAAFSETTSVEKVLVCTAEGLRWISVAELAENPPQEGHSYFGCSFDCVSGCDDKQPVLAPSPFQTAAHSVIEAHEWLHVHSQRQHIYARGIIPRAPPLFA